MSADGGARSAARPSAPSLRLARRILRDCGGTVLLGMDEVGRGALAGPVSVGAVAVRLETPTAPRGLHDSKLLAPAERERLVPHIRRWAVAWGVGHATNAEIDRWGILPALRVAGYRALDRLMGCGCDAEVAGCVGTGGAPVVLDGSYDWLRRPPLPPRDVGTTRTPVAPRAVHLVIKGDQRCAAVAAASVLAKVERDRMMVDLGAAEPRYGWTGNKGYAAPEHRAALLEHGPSPWHRVSWNITGVVPGGDDARRGQDVLVTDADLVAP